MRTHIFNVMTTLVAEQGALNITLEKLCKEADIPTGSFKHLMGCNFNDFRRAFQSNLDAHIAVTRKRLAAIERREQVLKQGLKLAESDGGILNVTLLAVAEKCGVSESTITHHFINTGVLRLAVLKFGVATGNARVSTQAAALYPDGILTSGE